MSIRILLADDHKIIRDGLRALLEKVPEMEVIGEAENGRSAVDLARRLNPHVVIMDISMPELNGIDATRQIREESPHIRVIALSMYFDRRYVAGMLKAGVSGYLLKNCASEELIKAIKEVLNNKTFMSPRIADMVVKDYAHLLSANESSPLDLLTAREREVLQLIAEGVKTNDIAMRLNVSIKTISTHRQQIMQKLHMDSVAELTLFALKEGVISLDSGEGS
jgi:two-component system, NarL family, response regulator NreC